MIWLARGQVSARREEAARHEEWVNSLATVLGRNADPGVYVNFLGNEGTARIREAYPQPTWDRLAAIKRRYDPANLFRRNQNIPPQPADPGDSRDRPRSGQP